MKGSCFAFFWKISSTVLVLNVGESSVARNYFSANLHSLDMQGFNTLFQIYIDDLPADVVCNVVIYRDDATRQPPTPYAIRFLLCGNNMSFLLNLILNLQLLQIGVWSSLLISLLAKLNLFHFITEITLVLLMQIWMNRSTMKTLLWCLHVLCWNLLVGGLLAILISLWMLLPLVLDIRWPYHNFLPPVAICMENALF